MSKKIGITGYKVQAGKIPIARKSPLSTTYEDYMNEVGADGKTREQRLKEGVDVYEVTTTNMRKIFVKAKDQDEAEKLARGQFEDMEEVLMISKNTSL